MINTRKQIALIDSIYLDEYILFRGGPMSHLKLQKILYYIQAYHLAYFNDPLIEDEFEAWVHGPVTRKLFQNLKDLSKLHDELEYEQDVETPDKILKKELTEEQIELIDDVIEAYCPLSGFQLETLTHSEEPWQIARKGYGIAEKCSVIIPKETMKNFYRSLLYVQV